MSCEALITKLLAEKDRRAFLHKHRAKLTVECFVELKARSDALLLSQPHSALEIAEAALDAASFASTTLAEATARWAKGNALVCLGRYGQSLSEYERACAIFQECGQDKLAVARLRINMVGVLKNLGRYEEAIEMADAARNVLSASSEWVHSHYMAILEMNVGSVFRLTGRYKESLLAYERGRAIFARLDNRVQVARMDINRARVLVCMDRFKEAETLLRAARRTLEKEGQSLSATRADLNLATLLSRQGLHRQALEMYERARSGFAALDNATDVAVTDLYRTFDYLSLNLLPEALSLATRVQHEFERLGMPRYAALAEGNCATAARKMGRYEEALHHLASARAFFMERGNKIEVALLDLERATCLREMGDVGNAVSVATKAVETLGAHELPLQLARARMALADCLMECGEVERATSLYTQAREAADVVPALAWRAHYGLGSSALARGRWYEAYQHFMQAIDYIEAVEAELGTSEFRAGFLDDKLMVYRRAVCLALELDEREVAFALTARSKGSAWRDIVGEKGNGEENDELEVLRRKWHWICSRLTRRDVDMPRGERSYQADLQNLERTIAEARRRHSPILQRQPLPTVAAICQRVPPGTLLLNYYCTPHQVIAFLFDADGMQVINHLAALPSVERMVGRWQFNVQSARLVTPDFDERDWITLRDEAIEILGKLYDMLMRPLEYYIEDRSALWIMPHDSLWAVPFGALYDGQCYLAQRVELTCLPAFGVLERSIERPWDASGLPLIVGYSQGGDLANTLAEARAVAAVLGEGQLLLEEQATAERLQEMLSGCTLLHIATHGVFRADAPMFSALRLADGWLTAEELSEWDLSHVNLATLSACETGMLLVRGSDLLGLARGFFRAGARQLVVSLWAVDDASTARLMTCFYKVLRAGSRPSAALRQAQTALLSELWHPLYWAGFMVMSLSDPGTSYAVPPFKADHQIPAR